MDSAEAIATLCAIGMGSLVSLLTYIKAVRTGRKVEQVHVLVNNRLDVALERIAQLGRTLEGAGVSIPERPGTGPPASDET